MQVTSAAPESEPGGVRMLRRMLRPFRLRIVGATLAFLVKDSPLWVLPIVTANIIDAVVRGSGWAPLVINTGIGAALVLINLPANALYGRIIEIGSHDALLAQDGAYARLYRVQLG